MIKNVIFDLGRVIYTYWPRVYVSKLGYSEQDTDTLMRIIFDSPLWPELDRGTHTIEEGIKILCEQSPEWAGDIKRVLGQNWVDEVIQIMPESLAFYNEVKRRGFKIYILSNFCTESFAQVRKRDAFFNDADGIVISAHERLIKPERELYERLLERYALVPGESVFIDDNKDNIAAAEAIGINGIVFMDIADCRRRFELFCQN